MWKQLALSALVSAAVAAVVAYLVARHENTWSDALLPDLGGEVYDLRHEVEALKARLPP